MKQIIYLTGFMGSGKSTIGLILANTLGWDFNDLDKVIEKKTGRKIREIFEMDGEEYFRRIETEALREVSNYNKTIISLGGGTIASAENMEILKSSGKLVYLKMSNEAAYGRLKYKRDRPSLKNITNDLTQEELMNNINDLMKERKIYYEQADFTIDTHKSSVGKTVDRIVNIISKTGFSG